MEGEEEEEVGGGGGGGWEEFGDRLSLVLLCWSLW